MDIEKDDYSSDACNMVAEMVKQNERPLLVLYVEMAKGQDFPDKVEVKRGDRTIVYRIT